MRPNGALQAKLAAAAVTAAALRAECQSSNSRTLHQHTTQNATDSVLGRGGGKENKTTASVLNTHAHLKLKKPSFKAAMKFNTHRIRHTYHQQVGRGRRERAGLLLQPHQRRRQRLHYLQSTRDRDATTHREIGVAGWGRVGGGPSLPPAYTHKPPHTLTPSHMLARAVTHTHAGGDGNETEKGEEKGGERQRERQ